MSDINNRVLIFLLSSIALITLPHAYNLPVAIVAFFATLLIWRFLAIWKAQLLPNKIIVSLVTLTSFWLMFNQYHSVVGKDAGTSLFVIALGLKLLEIKTQRDVYLLTYLTFIVASSLFLYQQTILMALYILFVCCVLFTTLIIINSATSHTWFALKKSATIIVQALPMAAVFFVLFPRAEAPRWALLKNQEQTKSGLTDTIEPGSISDLGLSSELVFRVKFNGEIPAKNQLYWRGPSYSFTDGKRWTHADDHTINPFLDTPKFSGKAYQYTVLIEPQSHHWVFALEMPVAYPEHVMQNAAYQLISSKPINTRVEYQLTSHINYNTGYITKTEYRENTQLPAPASSKINALVTKLHGFDRPPEAFIEALYDHFHKEKFYYTLSPPKMDESPIETFLFKTHYGFCSHYATAFVYLMRVAHIPARVIGGYQGGEINKVGNFLEVRQANAHAWAEVWLDNKGWVRFDPTAAIAPQRVERGVNIEQQIANHAVNFTPVVADNKAYDELKQLKQAWQSLDYNWQRWIINYNRANQSHFLSGFGIKDLKAMLSILLLITTFIAIVLAWLLLRKNPQQTDKVILIYQQFCQKLGKVKLHRHSNEGACDFAQRAALHFPEHSEQINAITRLYIGLRYSKNPNPQSFRQLKRLVAAFKLSDK